MMRARRGAGFAWALIFVSAISGTARAQSTTAPEEPPRPAAQPPPSDRQSRVTWAVTERVRNAALANQFRPGLSGDDRARVFRTTLQAELAWRRVAAGFEVLDARAYLTDAQSNISTGLVDPIDVLQGYVRVVGAPRPNLDVQIGRFSMELGSGRLVAQEAYRDVTRAFTGANVRWSPHAGGLVTAFGVVPVATRPDDPGGLLRNRIARGVEMTNQRFAGALYERDRLGRRLRGEAYLYGLRERDIPGRRETRDRKLWTVGLRRYRAPSVAAWDLDVESAWQRGRARATSAPSDARAGRRSARTAG